MIFLPFLITIAISHSFDQTFKLPQLQVNNGWLYLSAFHFTPHLVNLEIIVNVDGTSLTSQPQNLIIQGVPESEWQHERQHKCVSVLKMPVVMQGLKMDGSETYGIFQFAVAKEESYHFVLKDCHQLLKKEYQNENLAIRIRIKVLSNQLDPAFNQKEEEIQIVATNKEQAIPEEL